MRLFSDDRMSDSKGVQNTQPLLTVELRSSSDLLSVTESFVLAQLESRVKWLKLLSMIILKICCMSFLV